MPDSDGPPQQDDRHHGRSRSRSPVSPGCAGETEGAPGAQGAATAVPASRAAAPSAAPSAPPARGEAPARAPGAFSGATAAAEESRAVHKEPKPRSGEPRHRPGRPRRGPQHAPGSRDRPCAGPERLAGGRRSSSSGQGGRQVPRPRQPQPHPHQPPQAVPLQGRLPCRADAARPPPPHPSVRRPASRRRSCGANRTPGACSGRGGTARRRGRVPATGARSGGQEATGGVPRDKCRGQEWAHAARSEDESADKVPRPAAAEGDRARAADGMTRDKELGKSKGTGRTRRSASRAPRKAAGKRMEWSEARSASVGAAKGIDTGTRRIRAPAGQANAQVTWGRTCSTDRGTKALGRGRDPRARARAPWALWDRQDGARELRGRVERRDGDGGWGAPTVGRAADALHPCRHPTNVGAPHPP